MLINIMHTLCCKIPIFRRSKKSKKPDFTNDEVLFINPKFKAKNKVININIVKKTRNVKKEDALDNHIKEERKHTIDAVVVRIMKSRTNLKYNEILSECFNLITIFKP